MNKLKDLLKEDKTKLYNKIVDEAYAILKRAQRESGAQWVVTDDLNFYYGILYTVAKKYKVSPKEMNDFLDNTEMPV